VAQQAESEFTLDTAAELAAVEGGGEAIRGRSPWYLAWRRLRRNYFAFAALALFVIVVAACVAAPLYAHHVAHTGPYDQHILDTVKVNGKQLQVVSQGGVINGKLVASVPIGPQWFNAGGKYVLGADTLGRDIAVRLLYGGRNSLIVGFGSSAI
jgi:peptide/nickel transport system permease protein